MTPEAKEEEEENGDEGGALERLPSALRRNWLILVAGVLFLSGLLWSQTSLLRASLVVGVLALLRYGLAASPTTTVGFAILAAGFLGGPAVLLVGPAVLLAAAAARRWPASPGGPSWRDRVVSGGALVTMALLTVLVGDLRLGPLFPSRGGPSSGQGFAFDRRQGDGTSGDESLITRLINFVTGRRPSGEAAFGEDGPRVGEFGRGAANPPNDPGPDPWLIAALGFLLLLLLALAMWWWYFTRRRQRPQPIESALSLSRLVAIGKSIGRDRGSSEGPISYAQALERATGDDRLDKVGRLVSAEIYQSRSVDQVALSQGLDNLEQDPPPAIPWRRRIHDRFADAGDSRTSLKDRSLVLFGGVVALGLVALIAANLRGVSGIGPGNGTGPDLGDLGVGPEWPNAVDEPEAWRSLLDSDVSTIRRWEVCGKESFPQLSGEEGGGWSFEQVGVVGRGIDLRLDRASRSLEAEIAWRSLPSPSSPSIAAQLEGLRYQTLLRTDEETYQTSARGWVSQELSQFPTYHEDVFLTMPGVVSDFGLASTEPTMLVDAQGREFLRYESQPVSSVLAGDGAGPLLRWPVSVGRWVLDVWVGEDQRPQRVRLMSSAELQTWFEWRLVPTSEMTTPESIVRPPVCPVDPSAPDSGSPWLGATEWSPTLPELPLIAFDSDGRPYDITEAQPPDYKLPEWVEQGQISGRWDDFVIASPFLDPDDDPWGSDPPGDSPRWLRVTDDTWSESVQLSTLVNEESTNHLIRRSSESRAVRWEYISDIVPFAEESELQIVTAGEVLDDERYMDLAEQIWAGESLVEVDTSGDGKADSYLVDNFGYDNSSVFFGYDAEDELAAVLIRSQATEWRELQLEGEAPLSVREREAELAKCLSGETPLDGNSNCPGRRD